MNILIPNQINTEGSFARASTATYLDSDGIIKVAAIDVPRFAYNADGEFQGLMQEQAATNLLTNSDSFTGGVNATILADSVVAPDGTTTADVLTATAAGSISYSGKVYATFVAGTTYTFSIYLKKGDFKYVFLGSNSTTIAPFTTVFDLELGTLVSGVGVIEVLANGYFRCSSTGTGTASGAQTIYAIARSSPTTNAIAASAGQEMLTLWGAQLEVGSKASSYIPTAGTAVTRSADVLTGTGLIYSSVPENDYTEWNAATNYTLDTYVIRASQHKIYKNLIPGVDATLPENAPARWLEISATNRWKMFDTSLGTQTVLNDNIIVVLKDTSVIEALNVLNVDCSSIEIAISDSTNAVVYTHAISLAAFEILDWYQYFYEELFQKEDFTFLDIPSTTNTTITIKFIKNAAVDCKVGTLLEGRKYFIGISSYGSNLGIIDYSLKTTDEFGNVSITPRTFSKRLSANVLVNNQNIDKIVRVLSAFRTTPILYVLTDDDLYSAANLYGYYKDWNVRIVGETFSDCNIEIEGLT